MTFLVTGGAGFIGSSLIDKLLLNKNYQIISLDNYDNFYSKKVKLKNQENHFKYSNFECINDDIRNINKLTINKKIDVIIHLAAKAGVRPSIENAVEYFDVNVNGTVQMLEFAKKNNIKKFIFASSSSIYGINENVPWSENELNVSPISPYASSKLSCEKIGFTYSHLYNIQFLSLRFFTVYGPKQRPDLAIYKFINKIINKEPIEIYGNGQTRRDYTYIDDIIDGIISAIQYNESNFEIFNLGNNNTILLSKLINIISEITNSTPIINYKEEQDGDVPQTYADISKSNKLLKYCPKVDMNKGIEQQYRWMINQLKNG